MRHRIKAGKVGSFAPEKQKVELEQLEDRDVAEEVEEIFEEDSDFSSDDEAFAQWSSTIVLTQWNKVTDL
jgi:hypothetical protein